MRKLLEEKRAILRKEFAEMTEALGEWVSFKSGLVTLAVFVGCIAFLFGFGVAML